MPNSSASITNLLRHGRGLDGVARIEGQPQRREDQAADPPEQGERAAAHQAQRFHDGDIRRFQCAKVARDRAAGHARRSREGLDDGADPEGDGLADGPEHEVDLEGHERVTRDAEDHEHLDAPVAAARELEKQILHRLDRAHGAAAGPAPAGTNVQELDDRAEVAAGAHQEEQRQRQHRAGGNRDAEKRALPSRWLP